MIGRKSDKCAHVRALHDCADEAPRRHLYGFYHRDRRYHSINLSTGIIEFAYRVEASEIEAAKMYDRLGPYGNR